MVGNDVVDLRSADADPSTLSRRFDERVFCAEERETLGGSAERRWKLWAAKEAAYKVAVKQDPATIFSPSRFCVRLEKEAEAGVVTWASGIVPVRVRVEDGAVHAVAKTTSNRLITGLRRLEMVAPAGQEAEALSKAVRSLATTRLAIALRVDAGAIEIRKQDRLPELFVGGVRAPADLSLSHHGEVVGFVCEVFEARRALIAGRSPAHESAP